MQLVIMAEDAIDMVRACWISKGRYCRGPAAKFVHFVKLLCLAVVRTCPQDFLQWPSETIYYYPFLVRRLEKDRVSICPGLGPPALL